MSELVAAFNPDELRDDHGMWTDGGGIHYDRLQDRAGQPVSAEEWKAASQKWAASFTPDQLYHIHAYTADSSALNGYLRDDNAFSNPGQEDFALSLDNSLAKAPPLEHDVTVFRGMRNHGDYLGDLKPGDTITDQAFMSSGRTLQVAQVFGGVPGVSIELTHPTTGEKETFTAKRLDDYEEGPAKQPNILVTTVPKGTHLGIWDETQEALLPRGSTIRVDRVEMDGNVRMIYGTVVSAPVGKDAPPFKVKQEYVSDPYLRIGSGSELENAVKNFKGDPAEKDYIIRRAHDLSFVDSLPPEWRAEVPKSKRELGFTAAFDPSEARDDHGIRDNYMPMAASAGPDTGFQSRWQEGQQKVAPLEEPLRVKYEEALHAQRRKIVAAYRAQMEVMTAASQPVGSAGNVPPQSLIDQAALAASITGRSQAVRRQILNGVVGETLGDPRAGELPIMKDLMGRIDAVQADNAYLAVNDAVASVLNDATVNGWTVPETADELNKVLTDWAPWQATRLARTSLVGIANGASLASAQSLGDAAPQYKTWLTAGDEKVRPTHQAANRETVPVDQPFTVGDFPMMYPGDPLAPDALTQNCRCTLVYSESEHPDLVYSPTSPEAAPEFANALYHLDGTSRYDVEGGLVPGMKWDPNFGIDPATGLPGKLFDNDNQMLLGPHAFLASQFLDPRFAVRLGGLKIGKALLAGAIGLPEWLVPVRFEAEAIGKVGFEARHAIAHGPEDITQHIYEHILTGNEKQDQATQNPDTPLTTESVRADLVAKVKATARRFGMPDRQIYTIAPDGLWHALQATEQVVRAALKAPTTKTEREAEKAIEGVAVQDPGLAQRLIENLTTAVTAAFNPDEPRDFHGMWTDGGGGVHELARKPAPPREQSRPEDLQEDDLSGLFKSAHPKAEVVPAIQFKSAAEAEAWFKGRGVDANFLGTTDPSELSIIGSAASAFDHESTLFPDIAGENGLKAVMMSQDPRLAYATGSGDIAFHPDEYIPPGAAGFEQEGVWATTIPYAPVAPGLTKEEAQKIWQGKGEDKFPSAIVLNSKESGRKAITDTSDMAKNGYAVGSPEQAFAHELGHVHMNANGTVDVMHAYLQGLDTMQKKIATDQGTLARRLLITPTDVPRTLGDFTDGGRAVVTFGISPYGMASPQEGFAEHFVRLTYPESGDRPPTTGDVPKAVVPDIQKYRQVWADETNRALGYEILPGYDPQSMSYGEASKIALKPWKAAHPDVPRTPPLYPAAKR